MNTNTHVSYGALETRTLPPRPRAPSRNDDEYLFSNPVNAALLQEAIDDSRAGRNMIPVTIEELEALFDRGET